MSAHHPAFPSPAPPSLSTRRGSVSRIAGMSFADLQRESEAFWAKAFPEKVRGMWGRGQVLGGAVMPPASHASGTKCPVRWLYAADPVILQCMICVLQATDYSVPPSVTTQCLCLPALP